MYFKTGPSKQQTALVQYRSTSARVTSKEEYLGITQFHVARVKFFEWTSSLHFQLPREGWMHRSDGGCELVHYRTPLTPLACVRKDVYLNTTRNNC